MNSFLRLNRHRLPVTQIDLTLTVLQMASSQITEPARADWLREDPVAV